MNNVYFVGGDYMGCNYLRCWLPALHNGWNYNFRGIGRNSKVPVERTLEELKYAEVISFHRPENIQHHKAAIGLKQQAIAEGRDVKIVFDNDDTFELDKDHPYFSSEQLSKEELQKRLEQKQNLLNNFILNADLVTTTTEYLAKEYRKINKNVVVLPNCVDPDDWAEEPQRYIGSKVRIGFTNSVAYEQDYQVIEDLIRELDADDRVQVVLFALDKKENRWKDLRTTRTFREEYKFWDSLKNLEHIEWVEMEDYMDTLDDLQLDICLIPRKESRTNKAKSNLKFLECGMLEIPVIASKFEDGPYNDDIDGENGILVENDPVKWKEAVYKLINDKELRISMGKKAKEYTLKHFHIKDHYHKWEEAFNKLTQ